MLQARGQYRLSTRHNLLQTNKPIPYASPPPQRILTFSVLPRPCNNDACSRGPLSQVSTSSTKITHNDQPTDGSFPARRTFGTYFRLYSAPFRRRLSRYTKTAFNQSRLWGALTGSAPDWERCWIHKVREVILLECLYVLGIGEMVWMFCDWERERERVLFC